MAKGGVLALAWREKVGYNPTFPSAIDYNRRGYERFIDEPQAEFLKYPVIPGLVGLGQGRRINARSYYKMIDRLLQSL